MVTNIYRPIFDFSDTYNATVLETTDISHNKVLKVYVAKVMTGIEKGDPKISKFQTNGYSIFANNVNRPAITGRLIKEKNYLESTFNSDSNVNDIENVSFNLVKEIQGTVNKLAIENGLYTIPEENKKMNYTIEKGSQIRVEFLNNKINKLAYNITDNSNYTSEIQKTD